jgi:predicted unusual protein kinase regulating ubiquinone biosynthesis (AarF/ABC1/UbiB family)
VDRKRYRRVRRFFVGVLFHALWWDLIMAFPVLRWFRKAPTARWQKIARRYRLLAIEMGGVLIKLGQFLSTRADILPIEITTELAGLQDEVPPETAKAIRDQIEADFGCPLGEIFAWFAPQPLGAASLAQAHEVRTHEGQELVVKVLRPGIHGIVETDLAAVALATRWLSIYGPILKRIDLQWLTDEFAAVTRKELDLNAEGHNIERFAETFKNDPTVYIPEVHWQYCAGHTLALENVDFIRIGDLEAIEAAGISRAQVADSLYTVYMKQVFDTHFVHVDPHPGNLFIKPLPYPEENRDEPENNLSEDTIRDNQGRPFQIAFVDFGMTATIHPRMHAAMREYVVGVGTRDAHRIVQSYLKAGVLLKGADLKLIEEAHEALFDRFWGVSVGDLRDVAMSEAGYFWEEYREVIFGQPFQVQADLLFIFRAVGILAGVATHLDPQFDPWGKAIPFAERYALEEIKQGIKSWRHEIENLGQIMYKMPKQMERVLSHAQRGSLTVQTSLTPTTRKTIRRLERSVKRLSWMMMAAAFLTAGVILYVAGPEPQAGWIFGGLSLLSLVWALRN